MSSYVEREYRRYAHHAALSGSCDGVFVEGHTVNVSRGGLCAMVAVALPVGSDFHIALSLCFEDGGRSQPLSLWSRVVWCTGIDERFQIGLALVNVDTTTLGELELLLRFLDEREQG